MARAMTAATAVAASAANSNFISTPLGRSRRIPAIRDAASYLAALRNPDIQILGYPRGRVYIHRVGLTADWERVFGAAELDKAVEIDAYPDPQDLSMNLVRIAKTSGCRISLGTDSHDPQQLRFMDFASHPQLR